MQEPPTELSRPGLARFRSAPATWLDALLEDDDSVKPSPGPQAQQSHLGGSLTQLLTSVGPGLSPSSAQVGPAQVGNYMQPATPDPGFQANSGSSAAGAFQRMNSSPAEFMGAGGIDGFFATSVGMNPSSSYDFDGSVSVKRLKEVDFESYSTSFAAQRRGELTTANSLVEMEMEKLLEDSVPCRVRAKRGCATHPRSIAERVRRTRISDRIRKLQELVPNMDKQTNTADMLEEAVEYVKTLQRQIQELTEQQKKCKCMTES